MPDDHTPKQANDSSAVEQAAFAPHDYGDARELGDWQSKYPDAARNEIVNEAIYLGVVFDFYFVLAIALLFVSTDGTYVREAPGAVIDNGVARAITAETGRRWLAPSFLGFCCAWAAGGVGGSLFGLKWMYHMPIIK